DQLAQRPHAEPLAVEARERPASGDLADLGAHTLEIVLADRFGDILDRGGQRSGPWKGITFRLGDGGDLVPDEPPRAEADVEQVVIDFPAAADNAACRNVEPCCPATDLDLLPVGKLEPPLPQRIVENDADVLELRIEISAWRKIERHADQLGRFEIDEQRADDRGALKALPPY